MHFRFFDGVFYVNLIEYVSGGHTLCAEEEAGTELFVIRAYPLLYYLLLLKLFKL